MLDFQERVIKERDELGEKKIALHKFFGTEVFSNLPVDEQVRLRLQHEYMGLYYEVLADRIQKFK